MGEVTVVPAFRPGHVRVEDPWLRPETSPGSGSPNREAVSCPGGRPVLKPGTTLAQVMVPTERPVIALRLVPGY